MNSERALHWEGTLSASYLLLTQGPIFVAVALAFGLDLVLIGVAAAFPMAFQVFQLLTPVLVRPGARLKTLLAIFNAIRFVWVALVFLLLESAEAPLPFLLVFALSQAANALAGNVWMILVQRIVPDATRGRFLARRNVYISVLSVVLVPLYSALMSYLPHPGGTIAVISLAILGTLLSMLFVLPLPDYRRLPQPKQGLLAPLRDPNFRRLALAHGYWNFAILLTAPFFTVHQIENIGIPLPAISIQTSAFGVLAIVCYRLWGGLADKLGIKSIALAGITIVAVTPWLWLLMIEGLWPLAMVLDVLNGAMGWAAVNIVMIAFPLEVGRRDAPAYFGMYFALGGLGGFLGSLLGGYSAALFHELSLNLGGYRLHGLQIFLIVGGLLRLGALPLFMAVQTEKFVPVPSVALNVLAVIARRSPLRVFENARIIAPTRPPGSRRNGRRG